MSVLLVTHDLGVVAGRTDEIAVMYAGKIVEKAPTQVAVRAHEDALHRGAAEEHPEAGERQPHPAPGHRRSPAGSRQPAEGMPLRAPLPVRAGAVPGGGATAGRGRDRRATSTPAGTRSARPSTTRPSSAAGPRASSPRRAWSADGRQRRRPPAARRRGAPVASRTSSSSSPSAAPACRCNAVSGISFDVLPGETLGLVGESGCGKSTTGRAIMQLPSPTGGSIRFDGQELTSLKGEAMRLLRTNVQMIFQDPISSLNPRRKVSEIVKEPLEIWGVGTKADRQDEGGVGARGGRHRPGRGLRPAAAPVLRRSVPAHLHRPGPRARPEAAHLRRAGLGARRERPGPGAQPARGAEGEVRPDDDLHRPRPRRREEHQRPGLRDVPREDVRGRSGRRALQGPVAPLHRRRCSTPSPSPTPR